ncbi:DUF3099 domain-containing protein [Streptomyces sp. HB2AG]|nr:DUF3099 domain-containing protein [Streptomyces sp. HB2AG]MCZ2526689.1 DUF3099 domain-containing protein [Streptomyces sp. HB2AG]
MSRHRPAPPPAGGTPRSQPHRRHLYFAMMGTCVALFVLAWGVVRLWSVPLAVAMCVVAMVIPPLAAITANRREPQDHWWDEDADGGAGGKSEGQESGNGKNWDEEYWDEADWRWHEEDLRGNDR